MSVEVYEQDGERFIEVSEVDLEHLARVGANFLLACHIAKKKPEDVMDALFAEGDA